MTDYADARTEIIDLLDRVCEVASIRHSNDEETFLECVICGEWDGHNDICPMPAIDKWMSIPYMEEKVK